MASDYIIDLDVQDRFYLPYGFKRELKQRKAEFGFGLLGAVVYFRTYSRQMWDGTQEQWSDTVIRVVEGVMSIRKWWYLRNGLRWDNDHWTSIAEEMADAIFSFRMLPPGRGLFAMGAEWMFRNGSAALYNCAATEARKLSDDAAWTTDMLMAGVGVGHSTEFFGEQVYKRPDATNPKRFVIPDSREGWAESIRVLIESYEQGGQAVEFDYSELRPAGAVIKTFGGTASGPEPLRKGHEQIRGCLDQYVEGTISGERLVIDVMNIIGTFVVAGNTRRSAEISLGSPRNDEFINFKNYDKFPERGEWGWMSNNSVALRDREDFEHLPMIADRVRHNGEPGVANFLNISKYGRYGEVMPDAATVMNPCAEVPLEDSEVCNLTEVFPTRCVDEYGNFSEKLFLRATELATLYSSTVSLLPTHSERTNAVIAKNRRIGVSISGYMDWVIQHPMTRIITWLDNGYKTVRAENRRLAREAGVPESVRVTTVKPSGSISLLAGVSSGMHLPPFSRYIRRVRIGESSPIVPLLTEAGVPIEPDMASANTLVAEFPIDRGQVRGQKDMSVWAKAQTVVTLQRWWADNMVSNTLSFDPEREGDQIEDLITLTVPFIKTISLMPMEDFGGRYAQLPEEQTTRDDIRERQKAISDVDWTKFGGSDGEDSKFCTTDNCEL